MTCAEFEAILPDLLEGGGTTAQRTHLTVCPACSELMSEINLISQQARLLRAADEPNPRVWNSIEIALRQEGLIHESGGPEVVTPPSPNSVRQWMVAWLLPATAAFLLTFGLLRLHRPSAPPQVAEHSTPAPAVASVAPPSRAVSPQ